MLDGTYQQTVATAAVNVVLVDDDPAFREGLRLLLESEGVAIVGEASDGREALWLMERHRPEVVLMDLRMPGMDGIEATKQINMKPRAPRVVALTTFDDDELNSITLIAIHGAMRRCRLRCLLTYLVYAPRAPRLRLASLVPHNQCDAV